MKNPFDRIVGPEGEQVFGSGDGSGADEALSERDEFILRCLNAAVNLYGIVTAKEFCENLFVARKKFLIGELIHRQPPWNDRCDQEVPVLTAHHPGLYGRCRLEPVFFCPKAAVPDRKAG